MQQWGVLIPNVIDLFQSPSSNRFYHFCARAFRALCSDSSRAASRRERPSLMTVTCTLRYRWAFQGAELAFCTNEKPTKIRKNISTHAGLPEGCDSYLQVSEEIPLFELDPSRSLLASIDYGIKQSAHLDLKLAPLARSRLLEMNFPKSPLVEHCVRRPGFSLEKNGFTRVN